jgi:hypothetical protein
MPTATDLVTDLPADFAVFGQAVATSMADLLGGTTGQILAKATNTDMDFTWVTNDVGDITAVTAGTGISGGGTSGAVTITNSMATAITTAGDLIKGTGSGTFDRLGIGSTGQVLTVTAGAPVWATPASGSTFAGCSLYKSALQTITTATNTVLTWDTENFDTNTFHNNVTNNSRITIPSGKDGYYLFNIACAWSGATGDFRLLRLYKNGAEITFNYVAPATYGPGQALTYIASAVATDYFEVYVYQDSGANRNVAGGSAESNFQCQYLGA